MGEKFEIRVEVTQESINAVTNNVESAIRKLENTPIRLSIDEDKALSSIKSISNQLKKLSEGKFDFKIGTSSISSFTKTIESATKSVSKIGDSAISDVSSSISMLNSISGSLEKTGNKDMFKDTIAGINMLQSSLKGAAAHGIDTNVLRGKLSEISTMIEEELKKPASEIDLSELHKNINNTFNDITKDVERQVKSTATYAQELKKLQNTAFGDIGIKTTKNKGEVTQFYNPDQIKSAIANVRNLQDVSNALGKSGVDVAEITEKLKMAHQFLSDSGKGKFDDRTNSIMQASMLYKQAADMMQPYIDKVKELDSVRIGQIDKAAELEIDPSTSAATIEKLQTQLLEMISGMKNLGKIPVVVDEAKLAESLDTAIASLTQNPREVTFNASITNIDDVTSQVNTALQGIDNIKPVVSAQGLKLDDSTTIEAQISSAFTNALSASGGFVVKISELIPPDNPITVDVIPNFLTPDGGVSMDINANIVGGQVNSGNIVDVATVGHTQQSVIESALSTVFSQLSSQANRQQLASNPLDRRETSVLIGRNGALYSVQNSSQGTVTSSELNMNYARAISDAILMDLHNHPSGSSNFSPKDVESYANRSYDQGARIFGVVGSKEINTLDFSGLAKESVTSFLHAYIGELKNAARANPAFQYNDRDMKLELNPDADNYKANKAENEIALSKAKLDAFDAAVQKSELADRNIKYSADGADGTKPISELAAVLQEMSNNASGATTPLERIVSLVNQFNGIQVPESNKGYEDIANAYNKGLLSPEKVVAQYQTRAQLNKIASQSSFSDAYKKYTNPNIDAMINDISRIQRRAGLIGLDSGDTKMLAGLSSRLTAAKKIDDSDTRTKEVANSIKLFDEMLPRIQNLANDAIRNSIDANKKLVGDVNTITPDNQAQIANADAVIEKNKEVASSYEQLKQAVSDYANASNEYNNVESDEQGDKYLDKMEAISSQIYAMSTTGDVGDSVDGILGDLDNLNIDESEALNQLCQLLGVSVPSAAESATSALEQVGNATQNIGTSNRTEQLASGNQQVAESANIAAEAMQNEATIATEVGSAATSVEGMVAANEETASSASVATQAVEQESSAMQNVATSISMIDAEQFSQLTQVITDAQTALSNLSESITSMITQMTSEGSISSALFAEDGIEKAQAFAQNIANISSALTNVKPTNVTMADEELKKLAATIAEISATKPQTLSFNDAQIQNVSSALETLKASLQSGDVNNIIAIKTAIEQVSAALTSVSKDGQVKLTADASALIDTLNSATSATKIVPINADMTQAEATMNSFFEQSRYVKVNLKNEGTKSAYENYKTEAKALKSMYAAERDYISNKNKYGENNTATRNSLDTYLNAQAVYATAHANAKNNGIVYTETQLKSLKETEESCIASTEKLRASLSGKIENDTVPQYTKQLDTLKQAYQDTGIRDKEASAMFQYMNKAINSIANNKTLEGKQSAIDRFLSKLDEAKAKVQDLQNQSEAQNAAFDRIVKATRVQSEAERQYIKDKTLYGKDDSRAKDSYQSYVNASNERSNAESDFARAGYAATKQQLEQLTVVQNECINSTNRLNAELSGKIEYGSIDKYTDKLNALKEKYSNFGVKDSNVESLFSSIKTSIDSIASSSSLDEKAQELSNLINLMKQAESAVSNMSKGKTQADYFNDIVKATKNKSSAYDSYIKNRAQYGSDNSATQNSLNAYTRASNALDSANAAFSNNGLTMTTQQVQELAQVATDCKAKTDALIASLSGKIESDAVTKYTSQLDALEEKFNKLGQDDPELTSKLDTIRTGLQNIKLLPTLEEKSQALDELVKKLEEAKKEVSGLSDKAKNVGRIQGLDKNIDSFVKQYSSFIDKSPKLSDGFANLKKNINEMDFSVAKSQFDLLKQATLDSISPLDLAAAKIKSMATTKIGYMMIGRLAMYVRQLVKQIYTNVKEIDSALAQLQIVTGQSDSQMSKAFEMAAQSAQKYGTSISDVLGSMETFARLGYEMQDALALSEQATVLSNVADVSVEDSTTGLTSIIKGFGLEAKDASMVADELTAVGQSYAISASELMEAFQNGGSSLSAAGNTLEESMALFAAGNASVQNASTVGNAMKTMAARLRSSTAELDEMGEEYDDLVASASKYRAEIKALSGVDIMQNDTTYKSTYDILSEIAAKWNEIDDVSRAALLEDIAGKRNTNVALSIITNLEDLAGAYDTANDAAGTAAEANAIYMDTIQAKTGQLKASYQEMSADFLDSTLVKNVVDMVNLIVKAIDKLINSIGSLGTIGVGVTLSKLLKNFRQIPDEIGYISIAFQEAYVASREAGGAMAQNITAGFLGAFSYAPFLAAIAGLASVIAIGKLEYQFSSEKRYDDAIESIDVYSDDQRELDSINDRLSEINSRINEINSQNGLSLVDKAELDELAKEKELLSGNKALQENNQEENKQKAYKDAEKFLQRRYRRKDTDGIFGTIVDMVSPAPSYDNVFEYAKDMFDTYNGVNENARVSPEIAYARYLDAYNEIVEMSDIVFEVDPDGETAQQINDFFQYVLTGKEIAKQTEDAIDKLFKTKFASDKSDIMEWANSDMSDEDFQDNIAGVSGLQEALESAGISVEDFRAYMSYLAIVLADTTVASDDFAGSVGEQSVYLGQLSDAVSTLTDAYETLNQVSSDYAINGGLTAETTKSIIDALQDENYKKDKDGNGISYLEDTGKSLSDFLTMENGNLKLNTDAWNEYAESRYNALKADAVERINYLNNQNGMMYGADVTGKRITSRDIELYNANNLEIEQLEGDVAAYDMYINQIKNDTTSLFDTFDALSSRSDMFTSISEAMEHGGASMTEALEWVKEVPELASYFDNILDGTLSDETLDSILTQGYLSQIDALNKKLEETTDPSTIAQINALKGAYLEMLSAMSETDKVGRVINKGLSSVDDSLAKTKQQVKNLWSSNEFADARSDLESLAKESGITASDIRDLAEDNEYLAGLIDETGLSAEFLAQIFEDMSVSGSGALDGITEDAIKLDQIFSYMDDSVNAANKALQDYQNSYDSWDYNDQYNGYKDVWDNTFESIYGQDYDSWAEGNEPSKIGEHGADYWRGVQTLLGENYDSNNLEATDKKIQKIGSWFNQDDNGFTFLDEFVKDQSKIKGLADDTFASLDAEGNYKFSFNKDDFAKIADYYGTTEEVIASMVQALGMFGDTATYTSDELKNVFKESALSVQDGSGDIIMSVQGVKSQLESLGLEDWQVKAVMDDLKANENVKLFDLDNASEAYNYVSSVVKALGGAEKQVNLNDFYDTMKSAGYSANEIKSMLSSDQFTSALEKNGYKIVGENGQELSTRVQNAMIDIYESSGRATLPVDVTLNTANMSEEASKLAALLSEYSNSVNQYGIDSTQATEAEQAVREYIDTLGEVPEEISTQFNIDSGEDVEAQTNALINKAGTEGANVAVTVDTTQLLQSINEAVTSLSDLFTNTGDNQITFSTNAEEIASELSALSDKLKEIAENSNINISIGGNTDNASSEADASNSNSTVVIDGDNSGAISAISAVSSALSGLISRAYTITISANVSSALSAIDSVKSALNSLQDKTVNVTTNYTENGSKPSGGGSSGGGGTSPAFGSARASGSAFAGGNWGIKRGGKALVGELGPEIMVDPANMSWRTVGDNGAEFVDLPDNAIVFNHKQSEYLLKYGRINNRGRALASGTARATVGSLGKYPASTGKVWGSSSSSSSNSSSGGGSGAAAEIPDKLDLIEILLDRIERRISHFETTAKSAYKSFAHRTIATIDEIAATREEIEAQEKAAKTYRNEASSLVSDVETKYGRYASAYGISTAMVEDYKSKLENGAFELLEIPQAYSEYVQPYIDKYKEYYEKALDAEDTVLDLHEQLGDLYKSLFDNVQTQFEYIMTGLENNQTALEGYISNVETVGGRVSEEFYKQLIANERATLLQQEKERQDLIEAMEYAMNSGEIEEYSEAWYEMNAAIDEVTMAIEESRSSVIEWQEAIRDLKWDEFDRMQSAISRLNDEAEFYLRLMDEEDAFDDNGAITSYGMAQIGLRVQEYDTYMAQADKYAKEIAELDEQLSSNPNNDKLLDRRNELLDAQRQAIQAAFDEKQALQDLAKEGVDAYLKSLDELIDKYRKARDNARDMFEYQRDVAEQVKEIAKLQRQYDVNRNNDTEEGRKTVQELRVKLQEAEQDLQDTQYEQFVSDVDDIIDDMRDELEETLNDRVDDIDALIVEFIGVANTNTSDIQKTLQQEGEAVGYKMSTSMSDIWSDFANDTFCVYGDNFLDAMAEIIGILNSINGGSSTESSAAAIIEMMRQNSKDYRDADDETKALLHKQNEDYAKQYEMITGDHLTYKGGAWYTSNGDRLYDTKGTTSNVVGGVSTLDLKQPTSIDTQIGELLAQGGSYTPQEITDNANGVIDTMKEAYDFAIATMQSLFPQYASYISTYASYIGEDKVAAFGKYAAESVNVEFNLPGVKNYDEFMREAQSDPRFAYLIKLLAYSDISGGASLAKNKVTF